MEGKHPEWVPKQKDIHWVLSLLARLRDGGTWMIPDGLGIMRVRHSRKVVTMMSGDVNHETIRRTIKVFEHLGWTVDVRSMPRED